MMSRVETLRKEHALLRALLGACEGAGHLELPGLLRQLHMAFEPHQRAKEKLYEDAAAACQDARDATTLTLLNIFRSNLQVMSNAVQGFFMNTDSDPERLRQRFRTVSSALRSMMETEEKSVFPLCLRHLARPRPAQTLRIESLRPAGGQ